MSDGDSLIDDTLLIVAAHPDDEVLGCGGAIARMAKERPVHIVILGEGETSRAPARDTGSQEQVASLQEQARAAAKVLGVQDVRFAALPDNRFDELALLDIVKQVEAVIDELRPKVVFTHHSSDLNIDHQLTAKATLTATRPVPGCPVQALYGFEIASSTEWSFGQTGDPFQANFFVTITETLDKKIEAMACYTGEMRPYPHPRSEIALRAIAARWGSVIGVEAAEPFQLVRQIW